MAEDHKPPPNMLDQLLLSYPQLDDISPSSWFCWSDNPAVPGRIGLNKVCHADMRFYQAGYDHLVTAFPVSDDRAVRYVRMLIDGPFRGFSDLISIEKKGKLSYVQVDGLDRWPANVFFNFCIATRVPIEFPDILSGWMNLIAAGYPEVLAFLLSSSTGGKPFAKARTFLISNHMWFDAPSDWINILAGTPNLDCKSFNLAPVSITPTNVIWGKSSDYEMIMHFSDEKVANFFGIELAPKLKPMIRSRSAQFYQPNHIGLGGNPALEIALPAHQQAFNNAVDVQPIAPWPAVAPPHWNLEPHDDQPDAVPEFFDDFPDFD